MAFIFQSYAGGVNAAAHPRLLTDGALTMLINGTVSSGMASPRPPFIQHEVAVLDQASATTFARGIVQGIGYHRSERGDALHIAVDGFIFRLSLTEDSIERAYFKQAFSKRSTRVEFCQRGPYQIAQDGVSPPVIIRGKSATQGTHPTQGVPVGHLMADGWGRLAVARSNRIYFSNHIADPNAEDLPKGIARELAFTEDTAYFLNTRYFQVPESSGKIIGMTFTPSLNGDGDLGPLAVFCERSTWLYNTRIPREEWTTQDIASNPLPHIGACSPDGITVRGNDVLFSDQTGRIQQMRIAVRRNDDARLKAYDSNVWPIIEHDHRTHLHRRLSAHLKERFTVIGVKPETVHMDDGRHTVRHCGILALNESPVIEGIQAVWDGLWTGIHPVAMIVAPWRGIETLFIVSLDSDGVNRIYRLGTEPGQDTANGVQRGQPMLAITRASSDEDPFRLKQAVSASINIGKATGNVSVEGDWIIDGKPPMPWFDKRYYSPTAFDSGFGATQDMPRILAPAPPGRAFSHAQIAITITGQATLEEIGVDTDKKSTPTNDTNSCRTDALLRQTPRCLDALHYDLLLALPFDDTAKPHGTAPVINGPIYIRGREGKRGKPGLDGKDGNNALPEGYELIPNEDETKLLLVFNGTPIGAIELYEPDSE